MNELGAKKRRPPCKKRFLLVSYRIYPVARRSDDRQKRRAVTAALSAEFVFNNRSARPMGAIEAWGT
jgi:hypothetical protein